jgi:UDP-2,3-diacylglucosamine pyrophosphatase LpxH
MKKTKKKTHTLILSDFHLGSIVSRSKKISELLREYDFKKLILLGDIFENLNFNHLKEEDWKLLSQISKISRKRKVIWVEGNHDKGLSKILSALTGGKVYKIYRWRYQNKRYLAIHGHQFDNFLVDNAFLSFFANQVYNIIQVFDFKDKRICHYIKERSRGWLRLSAKVAKRAILFAKVQQVDYIFCGHTHKAMKIRRGSTYYYNCGCWTDTPSTFITLNGKDIKINKHQ